MAIVTYENFVTFIISLKVVFFALAAIHLYYKVTNQGDSAADTIVEYIKARVEFMFMAMMAVLLVFLFNPRNPKIKILSSSPHTLTLLYMFGIVLLITDDWKLFVTTSPWFTKVQSLLNEPN